MPKPFYLSTAIAYVNAGPHLGHAMELAIADTIARYRRFEGRDTFFLTGTDEHGVKIYNTAKKEGIETPALVERNAQLFKDLLELLQVSNDDFIRTTDEKRHVPACQKLWQKLQEAGDIYEKEYEGLYCEGCEAFVPEKDLVTGECAIHKKPPVRLREKNYFFKLSRYSAKILQLIETGVLRLIPESRSHEILNLLREGLTDVSFSRPKSALPWGIPVPGDPTQVMYVWCDALTNYISALGYATGAAAFKKYWPAELHVIGKDIVRFHAGVWIGMLLSAGLPLPKGILVHGFVTHNGQKMSKSLGNGVDPLGLLKQYGPSAVRYYLLREIPAGKDGDFSDKLFLERYHSDLANNLGNLVNRLHNLITRSGVTALSFTSASGVSQTVGEAWRAYEAAMGEYRLHEALLEVFKLVDFANKRIDEEKPWALLKTDPAAAGEALLPLLELVRHVSAMLAPFLPDACAGIREVLGCGAVQTLEKEKVWGAAPGWNKLGTARILFPRFA